MDGLKKAKTIAGKVFHYTGSLSEGLAVHFELLTIEIAAETVEIVREIIRSRGLVPLGNNRKPMIKKSIGEALFKDHYISPEQLNYIMPLLLMEGFCSVKSLKPITISYRKGK